MTILESLVCTAKSKPVTTGLNMDRVATIILGGGQGTRLFPLTLTRCKPAISFGGSYRLIDIPLSNSINSGCLKIFVITQFLSSSLHQHIRKTYRLGTYTSGFIELLSAEEKPEKSEWFLGTADAVRQNVEYFIETPIDYILILSGDQLYHMNYQHMLRAALSTDADAVISVIPTAENETSRMGVLNIDENLMISEFYEKPTDPKILNKLRISKEIQEKTQLNLNERTPYLGSMGIYLFKREVLLKLLEDDPREDFGKHLIPTIIKQGKTSIYLHQGYWEDIGTIASFYRANMALTKANPEFDWYDENNPIISTQTNLPGPKFSNTCVKQSIICQGAVVEADEITNCILGPRTIVKKGAILRDSYLMGNDFYTPPIRTGRLPEKLQIGENCIIRNAIIDKNAYLGENVQLINKNNLSTFNSDGVYIRDGIIIVTRGASLPKGYIL